MARETIHIVEEEDVSAQGLDATQLVFVAARRKFATNHLFEGIGQGIIAHVESKTKEIICQPGEVIFEENDSGESLYLIAEGSVKISKRGRGGQQEMLTCLNKDDFFGEMALMDNGRRSAQAAATERTVLGKVDRALWNLLLKLAPQEIMVNFSRESNRRLRENNSLFIEQMMRSERLSLIGSTVSAIVHDMNNPISSILNACELMQLRVQEEFSHRMTDIIRESVDRMLAMTQELIDFSRGSTNLCIEHVSVPKLIDDLESIELHKCGKNKIHVERQLHYQGQIMVDCNRAVRLLTNLIKNAREAMPLGGTLTLKVAQRDNFAVFEVSDTGSGIAPDLLPRIFEPFVTHGKTGGTGLGLAIARSVAEAHHGSISVRSIENVGSTFEVCLPLTR